MASAEKNEPDAAALISASATENEKVRHFDAHIAPLLARHCLECHDTTSRKGRLDLSKREEAFAERRSGRALVPGDPDESLVWDYVQAGEMPPEDRSPMTDDEKELLRNWILSGAVWSGDEIDPFALSRDRRAIENWVQRLTLPEYIETVRAATGVDIRDEARRLLPQDLRADGFSNTAYNLGVDFAHVEAYARLAELIVQQMDPIAFAAEQTPEFDPKNPDMRQVITSVGKWILRGPLDDREIAAFQRIADAITQDGGDFSEALEYVVEAMLQAPRFIYRMETGGELAQHELASRLSYILWGGPPDRELLRAADAGELAGDQSLERQIERMLNDPRVIDRSVQFIMDWMDLGRLATLRPNPERFPEWNDKLAEDTRDETIQYFKHLAWEEKRPLADLMNAQVTLASPRLAYFYGLEENPARSSNGTPAFNGATSIPSHEGLLVLYRFDEGEGGLIRDSSNSDHPVHLKIEDTGAVEWTPAGLRIKSATLISSGEPPKRLIDAIKRSKAITVEAWITPANISQAGPARILSLSSGASQRNVTLGQNADRYEVRFRTTTTDSNGLPGPISPANSVATYPDHVIFTRDATGSSVLYVNGQKAFEGESGGDMRNWSDSFHIMLGNESTKDRPWLGTFHQIAVYNRALAEEEVRASGSIYVYDLSNVPSRGGLLTHASVLTVGGDEASMVTRGLFVLRDFLYSTVGSAPPGADTTPVPPAPGLSQRAVAEMRLADQSCTGCHSRFEPLAFGLEKFNGIGAFLETDEFGNRLRDDGEILFPGDTAPVSYQSSAELMDILAASPRVRMNITRKLTQFALGRPLVESDARSLERIHAKAQENGGTYASLITAILTSDLVRSPHENASQL